MLKHTLIAGLITASAFAYSQPALDIGGVKFGASLESQKAQMQKVNPQYQFSEIKTREGKVLGWQGIATNKNNGVNDQLLALQDDNGKIWYLGRVQKFDEGMHIPHDTYLAALKEKYGEPSSLSRDKQDFSWIYGRDYVFIKGPNPPSGICPSQAGGDVRTPRTEMSQLKSAGINLPVPGAFEPRCGLQMNVKLYKGVNSSMVFGSEIQIIEHQSRYDALEKKQQAADAAKQKAIDAMQGNKPKL
ncbi:hypothetical protein [Paracidovorax anthurii]|uniref:Uncharacterized protein n=1 Tax=Paracidovorax anthurii TaxID=78229 RepID=A0A328YHX8_9BURK|nr:hypothetical protein [Paracidovorax anthurii]RAR71602.1 hypothetical protein AX018_10937 [Paracidovorax anthurii]